MKSVSHGRRCPVSFAPSVPRSGDETEAALRYFRLLHRPNVDRHRLSKNRKRFASIELQTWTGIDPPAIVIDNLTAVLEELDTTDVTDGFVAVLFHPGVVSRFAPAMIGAVLINHLAHSVKQIPWSEGVVVPEWEDDLRFLGQWWISLRKSTSEAVQNTVEGLMLNPETDMYISLLTPEEAASAESLNCFVANLAVRVHGKLFDFDSLHMDNIPLTPSRMHVLWFRGLLKTRKVKPASEEGSGGDSPSPLISSPLDIKEDLLFEDLDADHHGRADSPVNELPLTALSLNYRLETLSFSVCSIGTASLAVLFAGIISSSSLKTPIRNLDLSYNNLNNDSLYVMITLLPLTKIRNLSLRGNHLFASDPECFRNFLSDGCYFVEELDLSYTALSPEQLSGLIHVLPKLNRLKVLLINGIVLSDQLISLLGKAIMKAKRVRVVSDCCHARIQSSMDQVLLHQKQKSAEPSLTFFERFYLASMEKGWKPPYIGALPRNYRPFTTNDPTLPENLYY